MNCLATIDIGTNSVLLLIIEQQADNSIKVLADVATICRLGQGIGQTGELAPEAMARTLATLKNYRAQCNQHNVSKMMAVGTQALRIASNAKTFLQQVQKELGFEIQVITGEREAELTWRAASTDFGKDIVVVDIGGGSTEIISCDRSLVRSFSRQKLESISLPIGTVVLTEQFCKSDPLTEDEFTQLKNFIDETVKNESTRAREYESTLVATAGTATTLAAMHQKMAVYHPAQIHGSILPVSDLQKMIEELKTKTLEERKKISGLHPDRADVILSGAVLLEQLAQIFHCSEITISDRGVRWGLVYEALSIPQR